MRREHLERFVEFLLIGVLLGVVEDLVAVTLATGASLDLRMIGIVVLVAVPFAAFSELIIDHDEIEFTENIVEFIRGRN